MSSACCVAALERKLLLIAAVAKVPTDQDTRIEVRTVYHPGLNFAQLENTEWLGRIDEFVCMRKSVMAESALMKDGHVQFLDAEW